MVAAAAAAAAASAYVTFSHLASCFLCHTHSHTHWQLESITKQCHSKIRQGQHKEQQKKILYIKAKYENGNKITYIKGVFYEYASGQLPHVVVVVTVAAQWAM